MPRIKEDGQGAFGVYEDGQKTRTLAKCCRCHGPIADRLTISLRLHGVKQQAKMSTPDGPICEGCLQDDLKAMDREGLR
jgi:hypothetical protein